MNLRGVVVGTVAGCWLVLMAGPGSAFAATPVGECTSSYSAYSFTDLAFDPAAQGIFPVVDANHDGLVCFKYYPNGPHAGHAGNLVDDKSAPHT